MRWIIQHAWRSMHLWIAPGAIQNFNGISEVWILRHLRKLLMTSTFHNPLLNPVFWWIYPSYFHLFTKMNPLMAWPGEHHLFSCPAFLSDIGFFPLDFDYPVLTCKVTHTRGERTISLLHCLAQGRPPQKLVSLCFTKYLVRVQTAVILTCIMEALIFP